MKNETFEKAKVLRSNIAATKQALVDIRQTIDGMSTTTQTHYYELQTHLNGRCLFNVGRTFDLQIEVLKAIESTFEAQIKMMEAKFDSL